MIKMSVRRSLLPCLGLALGCGAAAPEPPTIVSPNGEVCTGYPDSRTSPYRLPYPVGVSYTVVQGNCSGYGHSGFWKYSYDFGMPMGSVVTAARGGVVVFTSSVNPDTGSHDSTATPNLVLVRHDDSTIAVYSHLEQYQVRVRVNQLVAAGDTLALSGNSGYTANQPHLHFSLHACMSLPGFVADPQCPALPVTFVNPIPRPPGPLLVGQAYRAGSP
jgi:murein DD-endopeptidase MepM/ murein hydrolase activator NlpD